MSQSGIARRIKCLIGKSRDSEQTDLEVAAVAMSVGRPLWENRGRKALPSTNDPGRTARRGLLANGQPSVPFQGQKVTHSTAIHVSVKPTSASVVGIGRGSHTVGIMRDPR